MTTTADLARSTAFVATYADEITVRAKDIKALAIAYAEFMKAATAKQLVDAKKWAERLDGVQKLTGVELVGTAILNDYL